jgi:hypothetical protein
MWQRLRRKLGRLVRPRPARKKKPYHRIVEGTGPGAAAREVREGGRVCKEYVIELPPGYPAQRIAVRLSVPALPKRPAYAFTEHVTDEAGQPSQTVIAATVDGFAVSADLGETWRTIGVAPYRRRRFHHVKPLGAGEYLAQAEPLVSRRDQPHVADTIVVDEDGRVLATAPSLSVPWHGCRAVDFRDNVAMFAEYPPNPGREGRLASRVFRSLDRGRTWKVVFERAGDDVRHFHFLQARPGAPGEWWLTSGDAPQESRIWVTKNGGGDWTDVTDVPGKKLTAGSARYGRDLFRLTDLVWNGEDVIWGTDDLLWDAEGAPPGARLFRSKIASPLVPQEIGRCKWHIRSLVDVGDFYVAISQGCAEPDAVSRADARPGVYLLPKRVVEGAPNLVHLFDVDTYSSARTGFSYARASRAAVGGTFFTFRGANDVFHGGHQMLRWDAKFD